MNLVSRGIFYKFILFFIFALLSPLHFIFAQGYFQDDELKYTMLPNYPGAYEHVNIELKSNYFDLDSSEVSYFLDGKLVDKQIGLHNITFKTKGIGQKSEIKLVIKKYNGEIKTKIIKVIPAEVFLTYEIIKPYRPIGYLGKSIALSDSELRIFAFADMVDENQKRIDPANLIYQWYVNFEIDPENSGYGKRTYYISRLNAYPRKTDITVKVYTPGGRVIAKKTLHFEPHRTEVDFYLINSNLPFSFKNINNPDIISPTLDAKIMAVPYFMNNLVYESNVTWKINGKEAESVIGKPFTIILSNSLSAFVEQVNLFLRVKSPRRILQSSENTISVKFLKNNITGQNNENIDFFPQKNKNEKKGFGLF